MRGFRPPLCLENSLQFPEPGFLLYLQDMVYIYDGDRFTVGTLIREWTDWPRCRVYVQGLAFDVANLAQEPKTKVVNGMSWAQMVRLPGGSAVESFCVPESIEIIQFAHFADCHWLFSVTFASQSRLTTIAAEAFRHCPSLSSIFIPRSVEILGEFCFKDCHTLFRV
jgi:hypothetical protein